jgi:hypothetical protein
MTGLLSRLKASDASKKIPFQENPYPISPPFPLDLLLKFPPKSYSAKTLDNAGNSSKAER